MQLYGLYPLQSLLRVLCSEIPNAVIHTDVKTTLIKLMRLWKQETALQTLQLAQFTHHI